MMCVIITLFCIAHHYPSIQIEHRNACALVRAERPLFQATPQDIVWQGFSIAFDASVEELWLAWAGGVEWAFVIIGLDIIFDCFSWFL